MQIIKLFIFMIVVAGAPRSGTSVCMQTLAKLGIPTAAPAFLPEHKNIVEFNPGGYYELNDEFGVSDDRYKGMAVKLFGAQLYGTDKSLIDKLIWVVRDRAEAIASYEKMRPKLRHYYIKAEKVFDANIKLIKLCVDENTMIVRLSDIKSNPEKFVTDLVQYLGISPSEDQVESAIKNIL